MRGITLEGFSKNIVINKILIKAEKKIRMKLGRLILTMQNIFIALKMLLK